MILSPSICRLKNLEIKDSSSLVNFTKVVIEGANFNYRIAFVAHSFGLLIIEIIKYEIVKLACSPYCATVSRRL
jgi:hypothetical protein